MFIYGGQIFKYLVFGTVCPSQKYEDLNLFIAGEIVAHWIMLRASMISLLHVSACAFLPNACLGPTRERLENM